MHLCTYCIYITMYVCVRRFCPLVLQLNTPLLLCPQEQQRALLEGDYNDLQLSLEKTRNTVQLLEEQVRELEERENENLRRFQDHQVDYENLKDKLTDIAEDNTNLTQQLEEVKEENLSLQKECKMLESELEVTRTKIMRSVSVL